MTVQVRESAMRHTLPATHRAAAINRFGGPEVLTIHILPVPSLQGACAPRRRHVLGKIVLRVR